MMLFLVQWIVSQYFVQEFSWLHLLCISGASILIALAGNIWNDVEDIHLDLANGKQGIILPENATKAKIVAYTALFLGLVLGYLASNLARLEFFFFFCLAALLLWLYAHYLSRYKFLSNFIISFLISLAILLSYYLEVEHPNYQRKFDAWHELGLLLYAAYAFIYNWMREVIKDLEDKEGDVLAKRISLADIIGIKTVKLLLGLCFVALIVSIFVFMSFQDDLGKFKIIYLLNLLLLQFLALVLLFEAKSKNSFRRLSSLIKWIMLFGLLIPLLVS
ncbi:MAG: UbiA family prenyltransferase [Chitinophagales bacterium]|nr:UbiA family prenyltransferase [Chitinophagales bacterium]